MPLHSGTEDVPNGVVLWLSRIGDLDQFLVIFDAAVDGGSILCFGAGNLNSRQRTISSGPETQQIAHMVLAASY